MQFIWPDLDTKLHFSISLDTISLSELPTSHNQYSDNVKKYNMHLALSAYR